MTSADKFLPSDRSLSRTHHSLLISKVEELISQAWGFSHVIRHNPSPNPVSLEKRYLPQLEAHLTEFVIAEKSDGIRYLLVLGTLDGKGFCVMVNRKMQMFELSIYANSDYFKGSVFDGEMVIETVETNGSGGFDRQKFLVFDLVSLKGESRRHENLMQRYHEYLNTFDLEGKDILECDAQKWETLAFELADTKDKVVCLGNKMALQFFPKPFVQLVNVGSMWRSMHKLNHKSDGLILTRVNAPVGTGTDHNILKWKEHHTIDLIVKANYTKGKWHYRLFFQDNENLVESTDRTFELKDLSEDSPARPYYLQLQPNSVLRSTSKYFAETHQTTFSLLAECLCLLDTQQPIVWCTVLKWRRDKHTPNNANVVHRTLGNIVDNVTIEELIQLSTKKLYPLKI
jgi:hypothetical protein